MFNKLYPALAAIALLVIVPVCYAARVAPMVVTLDETGRGATARIEMTNDSEKELPVEARVYKGEVSEDGKLSLTPADEDFMVFPPQTVLKPLNQQVFRIQYLGGEPLERSAVYYVALKEIPLPLKDGESKVQLVMNFNVLVNVVPDGAKENPVIDRVTATERNGQTGIEVRITNPGTRFFAAGRNSWRITGQDENGEAFSRTLEASQVGAHVGYGLVPAGGARIFFIPTDAKLDGDTVGIRFGN